MASRGVYGASRGILELYIKTMNISNDTREVKELLESNLLTSVARDVKHVATLHHNTSRFILLEKFTKDNKVVGTYIAKSNNGVVDFVQFTERLFKVKIDDNRFLISFETDKIIWVGKYEQCTDNPLHFYYIENTCENGTRVTTYNKDKDFLFSFEDGSFYLVEPSIGFQTSNVRMSGDSHYVTNAYPYQIYFSTDGNNELFKYDILKHSLKVCYNFKGVEKDRFSGRVSKEDFEKLEYDLFYGQNRDDELNAIQEVEREIDEQNLLIYMEIKNNYEVPNYSPYNLYVCRPKDKDADYAILYYIFECGTIEKRITKEIYTYVFEDWVQILGHTSKHTILYSEDLCGDNKLIVNSYLGDDTTVYALEHQDYFNVHKFEESDYVCFYRDGSFVVVANNITLNPFNEVILEHNGAYKLDKDNNSIIFQEGDEVVEMILKENNITFRKHQSNSRREVI